MDKQRWKEIIEDRGLTQKHIAKKIGVSETDISSYIAGRRKPNHERLVAMCKILNCKIADLYPNSKRQVTYKLD
jgi:DNA-binding XRE family transcriptional regulator